jgi:hypothetical protein
MAEPQLSVRSTKARDLAHRLARREKRSIADIVERALEAYEVREAGREPASAFYARLSASYGTDIDLEAVIRDTRRVHPGPALIFLDTNGKGKNLVFWSNSKYEVFISFEMIK